MGAATWGLLAHAFKVSSRLNNPDSLRNSKILLKTDNSVVYSIKLRRVEQEVPVTVTSQKLLFKLLFRRCMYSFFPEICQSYYLHLKLFIRTQTFPSKWPKNTDSNEFTSAEQKRIHLCQGHSSKEEKKPWKMNLKQPIASTSSERSKFGIIHWNRQTNENQGTDKAVGEGCVLFPMLQQPFLGQKMLTIIVCEQLVRYVRVWSFQKRAIVA